MRRIKILSTIVLFVFLLVLCVSSLMSTTTYNKSVSKAKKETSIVDIKELQAYRNDQNRLKTAIKSYFENAIANGDIIGAGVSIVMGDSIVVSDGFGKRNVDSNDKVDGETVFRLGSLSKGFSGILAARLKNEGKLDWDDKVSDFIPGFRLGDSINTNKITLATILSHTAGTPYHTYTNLVEAGLPLSEIAMRFKNVKPISKPGSVYSYQNAMFALSGEIMSKTTGQDISTLFNQRFFEPLGMDNTSMDNQTLQHKDNIAIPHSKGRYGWRKLPLKNNYYNAITAGGISSSPVDMAKWMRFLLGHNPEIMNSSALKEAFNPFVENKGHTKYYQRWPGHLASYYGFGWRIHKFMESNDQEEKTIWHHGGSVNNYRNEIALYPEADLGICVLLNSNSRLAQNVIPDLYSIVQNVYSHAHSTIAMNNDVNNL